MGQKPTQGRIVNYFPTKGDTRIMAGSDEGQPLSAIITKTGLNGSGKPVVRLNVFTNNADMPVVHKHDVKLQEDLSDPQSGEEYWAWPVMEKEAKEEKPAAEKPAKKETKEATAAGK